MIQVKYFERQSVRCDQYVTYEITKIDYQVEGSNERKMKSSVSSHLHIVRPKLGHSPKNSVEPYDQLGNNSNLSKQ